MLDELWTALALILVIEGLLYAIFPGPMRRMILQVAEQPEGKLRVAALAVAIAGVVALYLVRG